VSLAGLLTLDATLLRRSQDGAPDEYGDPTWTTVSESVACEVQQEGASEDHGDAVQTSTYRAILAADAADVRGWDALDLAGVVYELDGDAWTVRNPRTGVVSHVEARVRRVE
jgi:hypothetical protein